MQILISEVNVTSFGITREILKKMDFNFSKMGSEEAKFLIFPELPRGGELSLTARQSYDSQLRYSMLPRVEDIMKKIVNQLREHLKILDIELSDLSYLSEGDQFILKELSSHVKINIKITPIKKIRYVYEDIFLNQSAEELHELGLKYLSAGDLWASKKIFTYLVNKYDNRRDVFKLATTYNMLLEAEKAEYYYNLYKHDGKVDHIVAANYMLAMLYARHHPKYLQDDQKAIVLLNEAYDLIKDKVTLESIFNRNGYALLLFKMGKVEETIILLKRCLNQIKQLDNSSSSVVLHESVLWFNLYQCYVTIGDNTNSRKTFYILKNMDPLFIEYYLEYSRNLLETDVENFLEFIESMPHHSNNFAEKYSLLGYYFRGTAKSLEYFSKAFELSNRTFSFWYDITYELTEFNLYNEAYNNLPLLNNKLYELNDEDLLNYILISAEIFYNLDRLDEFKRTIEIGYRIFPDSESIKEIIENAE
ncbi:TPA: tetratricopeptide repeat protein [Streptococcus pneumoniae]